jgi:D-alanyl-D-alanine endopeptidase (penicillin-binding protein 7)
MASKVRVNLTLDEALVAQMLAPPHSTVPPVSTYDGQTVSRYDLATLRPGTTLSRGELMHLSLMSSENRAAHALGRRRHGAHVSLPQPQGTQSHSRRRLSWQVVRMRRPAGEK